ncbi:PREDICTED: gamma-interferon-inducible lysosomal thiol reductase-like isoform X2 [Rhagoletis zephyria]|uniref:gamma-interferon-inducible lysosomal thiol reductase-like isoform X2 n=1 Tax=Rhagoletis zephyria TaxID=28612 RepID=UPI0008113A5F|nr:PREDICTED: gamma-interferon-inducible lysosomal thiol reductase-like isoform X2 [Rhagoletis zephyria]
MDETTNSSSASQLTSDQFLKVGVYYETLCPDSREFIRNSLYDAMIINDWIKYIDLELVPYGKVTSWTDPTTNITTLFCQHGHSECEQNALHACIVEHNDVKDQVKLISCLMNGHAKNLDECANDLVIDVSAVKECKAKRSTTDLLKKYGEKTDALDISFVPSVTFDEKFDRWRQRYFIYNFSVVFCREYKAKFNTIPPHC